jgi:hypothetical protein
MPRPFHASVHLVPHSTDARTLEILGGSHPGHAEYTAMKGQLTNVAATTLPPEFEAPDAELDHEGFVRAVEALAHAYDALTLSALTPLLGPLPCDGGQLVMIGESGAVCKPCIPAKPNCHIVDGVPGTSCPGTPRIRPTQWSPSSSPSAVFTLSVSYVFGELPSATP